MDERAKSNVDILWEFFCRPGQTREEFETELEALSDHERQALVANVASERFVTAAS